MCQSPLIIPNPYYRTGSKGLNFLHNTVDSHISVPCGQCADCVATRQSYFLQRVQMESLEHWLFYFTLTYNNESLVYTDTLDYQLPIPYYADICNMFKRIRKKCPLPLRYVVVSEYGKNTHRPHYHGFISVPKIPNLRIEDEKLHIMNIEQYLYDLVLSEWRRNYGSNRSPIWKPLCTYVSNADGHNYELHYVKPLVNQENSVSYYISKYLTKYDQRTYKLLQKIQLDNRLTDDETKHLLSCIKPRTVISKHFGYWKEPSIYHYIRNCINRSLPGPVMFYDIYTDSPFVLCPYYQKHIYNVQDRLTQYYEQVTPETPFSFKFNDFRTENEFLYDSKSKHYKQTIEELRKKINY